MDYTFVSQNRDKVQDHQSQPEKNEDMENEYGKFQSNVGLYSQEVDLLTGNSLNEFGSKNVGQVYFDEKDEVMNTFTNPVMTMDKTEESVAYPDSINT